MNPAIKEAPEQLSFLPRTLQMEAVVHCLHCNLFPIVPAAQLIFPCFLSCSFFFCFGAQLALRCRSNQWRYLCTHQVVFAVPIDAGWKRIVKIKEFIRCTHQRLVLVLFVSSVLWTRRKARLDWSNTVREGVLT